jgi:hypothetical protein
VVADTLALLDMVMLHCIALHSLHGQCTFLWKKVLILEKLDSSTEGWGARLEESLTAGSAIISRPRHMPAIAVA